MTPRPKALDIMYYVATPEFIGKWTDAKKGELICRMERAIGSLPQFDSIPAMLGKMDEAADQFDKANALGASGRQAARTDEGPR